MSETPMIRCGAVERSHPELQERAARIATGLAELGVGKGHNVAIVLANSVEFLEITVGIALAGANPVPVNWHGRSDEVGYLLSNSAAGAVFVHANFLRTVEDATSGSIPLIVVPTTDGPEPGTNHEYESWLAEHEPATTTDGASGLGMIYTSGTTGKPKGIVRESVSAESLVRMAMTVIGRMGLRPGGRTIVPAPLYHTAPNTAAVLATRLGMDITILPRFDPEELLAAIERHRIEQAQLVPTMFTRLLRLPEEVRGKYDLSSLQAIVHSAAPCPKPLKQQMIDWLGPIVIEYYGGSETGPIVWCTSEEWLAHPGTVGTPADGAAIRIIGPDNTPVPTGEDGVIYMNPADYWPGFTYHGDDQKRRDIELDGYVTVGDMGRLDADGYLYLTDRASDMVISGGVNIYPAEIEAVLYELPGVADCAVFGIPDEEYGESLAAHIELTAGAELTADDVRAFVRSRLAGFKVPKVVVFDDALPREESGKLFKRRIRDLYWQEAENQI